MGNSSSCCNEEKGSGTTAVVPVDKPLADASSLDDPTYQGESADGLYHGSGTKVFEDGSKFIGQWKKGTREGDGEFAQKDGSKYKGAWKDDVQHGEGVEDFADGTKYTGQFQNGQKAGKGKLAWKDGGSYEGQFKGNSPDGQGSSSWADGRKYTGEWKNNMMHGKGAFTSPEGHVYTGEYKDNQKHGAGVVKYTDGQTLTGTWKAGKQHGSFEVAKKDGSKQTQSWGNGVKGAPLGGAAHGPWKDDTFAASSSDIHAPRYFKSYADFGPTLQAFKGELGVKDYLTEEMYNRYKDQQTKGGVTLDKCIKGGVDTAQLGADWNTGKVGLLFGDAECVTLFKDLVHPLIVWRHGGPKLPHPPPNLNGDQLLDHTIIDESYVISTRIRTGRSISGFALPPSISADQRKELEAIVVKALATLGGELKGDYYPLAGSNTYAPKPNGIDKETEERLVKDHFLFQEPDEPMLLSWRMERDWPQARGIYHNEEKTALVWVNEEDHLRIISMQKGYNVRAVFDRFANLVKAVEAACKAAGKGLEISDMYGNVLSCPSNCGTGLRASMMIKIPLTTKEPTFKQWCADRKLQARGSGGFASKAADDGVRDVSNVDRMGKDEVTLANEMIQGVADLIKWEKELEAKQTK